MNKDKTLVLRPAAMEDADMLFAWANDPDTRRNSLHTEPIPYETHMAWFRKCLADESVDLFILMDGEEPAGQIRFVTENGDAAVNYSVAAEKRGMGYGTALVELGCGALVRQRADVGRFHAVVKENNIASQRVFEHNGFLLHQRQADCFVFDKTAKAGEAAICTKKTDKNEDGAL